MSSQDLKLSLQFTADARSLLDESKRAEEGVRKVGGAAADIEQSVRGAFGTAATANDNLGRSAKFSTEQLRTLGYTASDVAASLASGASPFTILLQQGGQVLQVFPNIIGKTLAFGAAAVAIGAPLAIIGSRMAEISRESRQLTVILDAMGNRAVITGEQLRQLAVASTETGSSRADAFAAAMELAHNRQLRSVELFKEILNLAPDVAAVLGSTVPEAAKKLGDAFGNGAAGVKKLDEELGFLTVDQARQVRLLNQQGDRAGALGIAMQALQERFGGASKAMRGDWGTALHDAGMAWDAFIDRLANSDVSRMVTGAVSRVAGDVRRALTSDRQAELRAELDRLDSEYKSLPEKVSGIQATHEAIIRRRIEVQRELNALTRQDNQPPAPPPAAGPAPIGGSGIMAGEQKHIDEMRDALNREREAMQGTSAERQVRIAGLQAETAALERGASPEAAKQERLIAEDRARLELNTSIADTTRQLSAEARGALLVADAYLTSSAAGQRAEAMRQAALESLQTGVNVEVRARQILATHAAEVAANGAASVAQLRAELAVRRLVGDAALQGVAAMDKAELAGKVELATLAERIALENADAETKVRLTEIIKAKTQAILDDDLAAKQRAVGPMIQSLRDETDLELTRLRVMGQSAEAQALAMARQRAIIDLRRTGIDVTGQLTDKERELADQYIVAAEKSARISYEVERQQELMKELADIGQCACEFPEGVVSDPVFVQMFEEAVL